MQVSLTERLVDRLIGAAAIPGTQHDKRSATPDVTSNVETPGASAHILCAGASENRGAFLLWTPGESLFENFFMAVHITPTNPLH